MATTITYPDVNSTFNATVDTEHADGMVKWDLATTFNYSDVNTTFNATIDAETGGGVSRGTWDLATTFNYSDVNTTFNATIDGETGGGVSRGTLVIIVLVMAGVIVLVVGSFMCLKRRDSHGFYVAGDTADPPGDTMHTHIPAPQEDLRDQHHTSHHVHPNGAPTDGKPTDETEFVADTLMYRTNRHSCKRRKSADELDRDDLCVVGGHGEMNAF